MWKNSKPCSLLYCRPMKIIFEKENKKLVQDVYKEYKVQMENLNNEEIEINGKTIKLEYVLHCTMIDGAVTNILTGTNAGAKCFICKATPKEMNRTDIEGFPEVDNYKYGLSLYIAG